MTITTHILINSGKQISLRYHTDSVRASL